MPGNIRALSVLISAWAGISPAFLFSQSEVGYRYGSMCCYSYSPEVNRKYGYAMHTLKEP